MVRTNRTPLRSSNSARLNTSLVCGYLRRRTGDVVQRLPLAYVSALFTMAVCERFAYIKERYIGDIP